MIKFKQLENTALKLGITDRTGGVSQGVYGGMNTNFYIAEQFEKACEDIKIAIDQLGLTGKIIIATRQTHSSNILYIDDHTDFKAFQAFDVSKTALRGYELYSVLDTDGLMTARTDLILMTFYADCVPLFLYDKQNHAVSIVHSGWRGTSNKIGARAIQMMKSRFGTKSDHLVAGIGQSAGQCCYEVDEPVRQRFLQTFKTSQVDDFMTFKGGDKYMIDLKMANKLIFIENHIAQEAVEIVAECTICQHERFHSHRHAAGGKRGSMSQICQLMPLK